MRGGGGGGDFFLLLQSWVNLTIVCFFSDGLKFKYIMTMKSTIYLSTPPKTNITPNNHACNSTLTLKNRGIREDTPIFWTINDPPRLQGLIHQIQSPHANYLLTSWVLELGSPECLNDRSLMTVVGPHRHDGLTNSHTSNSALGLTEGTSHSSLQSVEKERI